MHTHIHTHTHKHTHTHTHTHTRTHARTHTHMHVFTVWMLPRQCKTMNLDMWPSASNDQSNASSNSVLCTSTRTVANSKHPNSQNVAIHKMYTTCKGSWCIVPFERGRKRVSELTPLINSWLSQSVHLMLLTWVDRHNVIGPATTMLHDNACFMITYVFGVVMAW